MLHAPHLMGRSPPPADLMGIIDYCGLTSGLKMALDVGDSGSVSVSSSQNFNDLSGTGSNWFRGGNGSVNSQDPTFNGTVGGRSSSEYYSHDGADYFAFQTSNPSWVQGMHKADAQYTCAGWWYFTGYAGSGCGLLVSNGGDNAKVGMMWGVNSTRTMNFSITNGGGSNILSLAQPTDVGDLPLNQWLFLAGSVDMTVGTGVTKINGSTRLHSGLSFSGTPSTGNASNTITMSARAATFLPVPSGTRLGIVTAWQGRALSGGELEAMFEATRSRYGV